MAHKLPEPPAGLEAKCDTILLDLVTILATKQSNYRDKVIGDGDNAKPRNKYWQGIRIPATLPSDGNKLAPDKTLKPSDQSETWEDEAITLPASMECSVAVDIYDGPNGLGYVVRGEIEIANKKWIKIINIGNETYRNQDWTQHSL